MTVHHRAAHLVGAGYRERSKNRKIAIIFDSKTFDEIQEMAVGNGTSFAEAVRQLCNIGLERKALP